MACLTNKQRRRHARLLVVLLAVARPTCERAHDRERFDLNRSSHPGGLCRLLQQRRSLHFETSAKHVRVPPIAAWYRVAAMLAPAATEAGGDGGGTLARRRAGQGLRAED